MKKKNNGGLNNKRTRKMKKMKKVQMTSLKKLKMFMKIVTKMRMIMLIK
jgi:hypothetical protein